MKDDATMIQIETKTALPGLDDLVAISAILDRLAQRMGNDDSQADPVIKAAVMEARRVIPSLQRASSKPGAPPRSEPWKTK
jgi:hypothetical protein